LCHVNRTKIHLYALNIGVFFLFILVFGLGLYYSYKNKLSPEEKEQLKLKEQEHIMSKIKYYKEQQRNIKSRSSITGLPNM
jgi:hypothetical protein